MNNTLKMLSLIAIATLSFSIVGCEKTELPAPVVSYPTEEKPAPSTPPSKEVPPPVPDTLAKPLPTVPTVPSVPGQLRKVKWGPMDYKEFKYDSQGKLVKYNRQYNNVQGTDIVLRDEYMYAYDNAGKLISVTNRDGFRTEYTYSGDVWSEAISYDKLNRPLKKYQFEFNSKKQLGGYAEYNMSLNGDVTPKSKTSFTYDASGNLTRYTFFWYVESSHSFVRSTEIQFSGFDSKKYPKNADSFGDPVLQPLAFFVNNPGRREILSSYHPIEIYSYTYDSYGYPTSKRTSYIYDKALPSMEVVLEY